MLGYRPCCCPSPFSLRRPYRPYLDVFNSLFFTCHWIQFVFLLYNRLTCSAPIWSARPSSTRFLGEFSGMGLGSSAPCCGPRSGAEVRILVYSVIVLISIKSLTGASLRLATGHAMHAGM